MQRGKLPFRGGAELKRNEHWLSEVDCIIMEATTANRRLVDIAIIQAVEVDGKRRQVLRCDNCHGSLHRHVLYEWKERREELGLEVTWENVYRIISAMKENWLERRNRYLAKIGRRDLV